ncbi:PPOX class F420-dependent enzyme [Kribbella sp. ALI-6-A]|uniref:PPOX class F420-dependent oxidoreductase n=1 Tax=Kribbella sp. ALI-6-A TaxID=1933817 RepID=UPI00097C8A68|nr:PPOX class F420-dependent oxidoreductase [Kribbella sp. ALI-6-A]ONI68108.1 PPOX class F420-dependent enzyme [Kribbella sp. ALI-6-A]
MTTELPDQARALLDGANLAVLATVNADGSPQTSAIWVGRDGTDVLISSTAGLRKIRNLEADPRTSLIVIDATDPLRYAEIRGTATITPDSDRAVAQALAIKYEGPDAAAEYAELPPHVKRVVVRITPHHVVTRN